MDKNQITNTIKSLKRKARTVTLLIIVIAFAILFLVEPPIKYVLIILLIIVNLLLSSKILTAEYLLYDECNPKLYYAVVQGTLKQVPIDKQVIVAEFIGDYSSAIQISNSLIEKSKNDLVKLVHLTNISRNAFLAGDFELCQKTLDKFNALATGKKINNQQLLKNDFYISFINKEYVKSKELLADFESSVKRTRKSFDCQMLFYKAIVNFSLGDIETANSQFESIVSNFPNMYLAEKSKIYLNGTIDELKDIKISETPTELPETAKLVKPNKKEIIKPIICIVILIGCIIGGIYSISNDANDTIEQAIEEYDDIAVTNIENSIKVDDEYSIILYENVEESLGVAYVKTKYDKFVCKISNYDDYSQTENENYWAKMHVSGSTREISYKFFNDKNDAPKEYSILPIEYNNKTIYFCYKLKAKQKYYSNLYSIDFDKN